MLYPLSTETASGVVNKFVPPETMVHLGHAYTPVSLTCTAVQDAPSFEKAAASIPQRHLNRALVRLIFCRIMTTKQFFTSAAAGPGCLTSFQKYLYSKLNLITVALKRRRRQIGYALSASNVPSFQRLTD